MMDSQKHNSFQQVNNSTSSFNYNYDKSFQEQQLVFYFDPAASICKGNCFIKSEKQIKLDDENKQQNTPVIVNIHQEYKIIFKQLLSCHKNRLHIFLIILSLVIIFFLYYNYHKQFISGQKLIIQQKQKSQQIRFSKDLRKFLAIQEKFQIFSDQKIIFQNGTQQTVVFGVQLKNISNFKQKNQIVPMYMWLGDKPILWEYQRDLNSLKSYKFIRNCDSLIQKMQKFILKKFKSIQSILKSDLCRSIYLYFYGGLYADLDTAIDLKCLNQFLKGKKNHIQAAAKDGGPDLFLLYFKDPYNEELLKAIQKWDYYHTAKQWKGQFTPFIRYMKQKQVSHSGCVKHLQERTWQNNEKRKPDKNMNKNKAVKKI